MTFAAKQYLTGILIAGAFISPVQAQSNQPMTVEQYEAQAIAILESNRAIDEKIAQIGKLGELVQARAKLQQELERLMPKKAEKQVPEKQQATKSSNTPVEYSIPSGYDVETVYVAEIYGIGKDLTAQLYVGGESVPVELQHVKATKERVGDYIITDYTPNTVTFYNVETKETIRRRSTSAEQIARKVEHNNKIREKYNEQFALSTLDAQIQTYKESTRTPVAVNYEAVQAPAPYDTMEGK